ncbi:DUF4102 domain-containing protein [Allofrancisella guangzhouensis]|uniref:Arm DNA-binding domain-containing protein n=1 Tax=Allofrancisella guangzhouensis TaxID=594679 RepID=UPI000690210E|nr:Arm DNA-binding domain-containing protein [Allofrancisella guangzhouensis]MBK2027266.1 DUF4102 domain-containing protein [Allofrancisella guangzhouensis]MBK2044720.1 DUF4102 domain-containing protein [Allofrancisella guangzhouensis]MBK2045938.1 DUF4102 domain-containing protein [Allofrancisella guangzhouensis]
MVYKLILKTLVYHMKLNNAKIKNIKPNGKMQWIPDGNNLYLRVDKSGNKSWWYRFTLNNKRCWHSIGLLLTISLQEVRLQALEVRKLIDNGIDPRQEDKTSKSENITLRELALESGLGYSIFNPISKLLFTL